jgi:hypothetical protein
MMDGRVEMTCHQRDKVSSTWWWCMCVTCDVSRHPISLLTKSFIVGFIPSLIVRNPTPTVTASAKQELGALLLERSSAVKAHLAALIRMFATCIRRS